MALMTVATVATGFRDMTGGSLKAGRAVVASSCDRRAGALLGP